tara:strand:- start:120 stop:740 length:621 start_codon:yes stop_codon:yes gene_type:complete
MLDLENKMAAVIMIGGQSKRMGGGIKSFIEFNNKSIFDRIIERIKPQIKKIIINCNGEEMTLNKYNLPVIKDLKNGYLGPLAGIHTAMSWLKKNEPEVEWLITLPGDTPFIPDDMVIKFKNKISPNLKIILAKSENKIHPIIGVWNTSLFESLDKELNKGLRKIISWAELHPLEFLNFTSKKYDPFFNINLKEDIDLATKIEKDFL